MIQLRRILVPVDFSAPSQNALTYAAALADKFAAELILLHVVQDLAVFFPDAVAPTPVVLPPGEAMAAAVREGLDRFRRESHLGERPAREEVREGTPHAEIVAFAAEAKVDLIVMGTHGRSGLAHMFLGSVTERVLRRAPCPVLAVRQTQHVPGQGGAAQ
jgi:nucleotide-binding universal stress UspA family protein